MEGGEQTRPSLDSSKNKWARLPGREGEREEGREGGRGREGSECVGEVGVSATASAAHALNCEGGGGEQGCLYFDYWIDRTDATALLA